MSNKLLNILAALLFLAILAHQSLFIVSETDKVVELEFGKLVAADIKPGWHYKTPFVNDIKKFDSRILTLDTRPERFLTVEKKAVMVDLYAKWRILDVSHYYTATSGDEKIAQNIVSQRIIKGLSDEFAARTLHEVVSGERDQLMLVLRNKLNETIGSEVGIQIVDVRVKGINLPDEVSGEVFNRMRSERQKEASKHRSEGKEIAEGIRADADRQKKIIEANAFKQSELIRGDGDAKAAAIYAAAYNQDPEFYAFLRSLHAYKESFTGKSDILLIDPNSDFFKYLNSPHNK